MSFVSRVSPLTLSPAPPLQRTSKRTACVFSSLSLSFFLSLSLSLSTSLVLSFSRSLFLSFSLFSLSYSLSLSLFLGGWVRGWGGGWVGGWGGGRGKGGGSTPIPCDRCRPMSTVAGWWVNCQTSNRGITIWQAHGESASNVIASVRERVAVLHASLPPIVWLCYETECRSAKEMNRLLRQFIRMRSRQDAQLP